jgi:hypothetical protein
MIRFSGTNYQENIRTLHERPHQCQKETWGFSGEETRRAIGSIVLAARFRMSITTSTIPRT